MRFLKIGFTSLVFHTLRIIFRSLPFSDATKARMRTFFTTHMNSWVPRSTGRVGDAKLGRRARAMASGRATGYVDAFSNPIARPVPAKLVAFYLPQFHSVPENDAWWGKGFTEWRNVSRALPQFEGHVQPRLPSDLGFYDLSSPGVMEEQARLAQNYGITAFCFYFYWFEGKTILESPLQAWLADPSIEMEFCLCWANENWTRTWDGRSNHKLIEQQHSPQDDLNFISHVSAYLKDSRYLRVDGKPLLIVYRPGLLPDVRSTASRWRTWCRENGVGEIFIAYVQSFECPEPKDIGFDAAIEFPPNLSSGTDFTGKQNLLNPDYTGTVLDWRDLAAGFEKKVPARYLLFPGVNCGWDNEPRRPGQGRTYIHASPRRYRDWLANTISGRLPQESDSRRLVFLNAWNEWAEGAVLEPDMRLGHAWLAATREALEIARRRSAGRDDPSRKRPCVVIHAWHLDVFEELLLAVTSVGMDWTWVITTTPDKHEDVLGLLSKNGISAEVMAHENRGRDILPFLHVANLLLDRGEDIVLKLHTKKSPHRVDGSVWRNELLAELIGPGRAASAIRQFALDRKLGMLAPGNHFEPMERFLGANDDNLRYLQVRLGLGEADLGSQRFASGSMFWVRLEALRPLLDAHLDEWEFELDRAQLDGTMAHAVERMFVPVVDFAGYNVESASASQSDRKP